MPQNGTPGAGTIIRHTYDAVVVNTSLRPYIFLNARTKTGDEWSKTYKLPRSKRVCIHPEDWIVIRPEAERMQAQGLLSIVQDIVEETVSNRQRKPNVTINRKPDPADCLVDKYDPDRKTLKRFFSRTEDPGVDEARDDTMWFIDKNTNNVPKDGIDFRFQINGQVYSVFDTIASLNKSKCVEFTSSDWYNNRIEVIKSGVPTVPGQIGPHGLDAPTGYCYEAHTSEHLDADNKIKVELPIKINKSTGLVTIFKTGLVPAFNGSVVIDVIGS